MASHTVTTTDDQEKALVYAHEQSLLVVPPPIPDTPPPSPLTLEEYFQKQVNNYVLNPMVQQYLIDAGQLLVSSFATVPIENRSAALDDIKLAITDNGGTLPSPAVSAGARWLPPIKPIIPPLPPRE